VKKALLYFVLAHMEPGPKWQKISDPIPRSEAVKMIAAQWRLGRMARLFNPDTSSKRKQAS